MDIELYLPLWATLSCHTIMLLSLHGESQQMAHLVNHSIMGLSEVIRVLEYVIRGSTAVRWIEIPPHPAMKTIRQTDSLRNINRHLIIQVPAHILLRLPPDRSPGPAFSWHDIERHIREIGAFPVPLPVPTTRIRANRPRIIQNLNEGPYIIFDIRIPIVDDR